MATPPLTRLSRIGRSADAHGMGTTISRRRFLTTTSVGVAGTYLALDGVGGATARAASETALRGLERRGADTVVVQFNAAALEAIRQTHPGPPIVARMLAVVHTCIYDAWAAYDRRAAGVAFTDPVARVRGARRRDAAVHEAIAFAGYRALVDLFPQPAQRQQFDALMASLGYDPAQTSTDTEDPSGVGNAAAAAVLEMRHSDGSNQLGSTPYADTSGYAPRNTPDEILDPDHWQPLRVTAADGTTTVQRYVTPHWGGVTPFALRSGDQFRPDQGPATSDQRLYRRQAQDIIDFTADLNDRRKSIAEYWADGPSSELPPGHWCLFAQFVSRRDRNSVDEDVRMFFAMTSAVLDASIACWDAKRAYDSVRPVTAIHYAFADQDIPTWGGRTIPGSEWRPYQVSTVVTPPFPEFISGHSTFSAAAAEVLRRFTHSDWFGGSVTLAAGSGRVEPGVVPARDLTLRWPTFSDAADQAGISRRYGGIHFEQGDLEGRAVGRRVGAQAWDHARELFRGDD